MLDSNETNQDATANQHQEPTDAHQPGNDYLADARAAFDEGDRVLAMHLFLSAYEEACKESPMPSMAAVSALREAWQLACELKERSIAEYIFDKLEPHLSAEETERCAHELQGLALDKLSEFGISRADLEDMAEMISEEIGATAHISGITAIKSASHRAPGDAAQSAGPGRPVLSAPSSGPASAKPSATERAKAHRHTMDFSDLVGFDSIIDDAHALGLGVNQDEEYRMLIDTLRAQHGLDGLSAVGSIVFRTSSREDASTFMMALVGELELPAMRVQMQPGPQGMPILCVTVTADRQPRMTPNRATLEAPGVLVLEDIDLWGAPLIEAASALDGEGIMFASMSRAARETVSLIGAAVANPEIYVLASMAGDAPDQGYLYDMMEPMNIIDIYLPDEIDRRKIWNRVALDHPSVRQLDLSRLTRLSRNLSRCDIATAAREAVEDAYRQSLRERRYVPVTQSMMFEHLANFQPLDSKEYRALEEAVVAGFRAQLDTDIDALALEAEYEANPEALGEGGTTPSQGPSPTGLMSSSNQTDGN